MIDERIPLSLCVTAATRLTPLIVSGCVKAAHSTTRPRADRERALNAAIASTMLLLEELLLQRGRLGWRDNEDAA